MKVAPLAALLLACAPLVASAQSPGVPVYAEGHGAHPLAQLSRAAKKLRDSGSLLSAAKVREQSKRRTCELNLPVASTEKLETRQLWQRARQSHVRIGWLYLCTDCDKWHLGLSGGYAITKNTAATCDHVVEPLEDMKEGYLVAADDDDNLFAVTEVLATNPALDSAIVRLNTDKLTPVAYTCDVQPGDNVYCFSDPVDRRGYFSQGMVNRFIKRPFLSEQELRGDDDGKTTPVSRSSLHKKSPAHVMPTPTWLEVNTEWAQGSSGSAVLDIYGNAVGHVSEIESVLEDPDPDAKRKPLGTMIVFHDAIAACNVLSLIKPTAPLAETASPQ
jgi:hypothetical protein